MRPVVIATDFSDVATHAAHYACNMAVAQQSPVIVLHTYSIPVTFHENPMPAISLEEGKNIAISQMQKLVDDLRGNFNNLAISHKVQYGDITEAITDIIAEENPWIVVVGNSSSENQGFWLGSNLLSTLRNADCPVLAIPAHCDYKKVSSIAFACDFKDITSWLPTVELVNMVQRMDAVLHVINVDHKGNNIDDMAEEQVGLNELIREVSPQYHYVDNENIDAALEEFVTAHNIDWLIVVPHKHSFFEGLFHKSQTKAIVHNAQIPILALHEKS